MEVSANVLKLGQPGLTLLDWNRVGPVGIKYWRFSPVMNK